MKNKIILITLLHSLLISCSVSNKISREFKKEEAQREDLRGFVVYDPDRDKELINLNGHKHFIPGSTVKLFTFYTAYMTLPDSVASIEYLKSGDSLFIRGTAAPGVLEGENDPVLAFLRNREEQIFLVDRAMPDEVYGPGWSWEDYDQGFMPERSLFPLYGNRVTLSGLAEGLRVIPDLFEEEVESQPGSSGSAGQTAKRRDPFKNHFYLNSLEEGQETRIPFITSNQLTADLLGGAIDRKVTLFSGKEKERFRELKTQAYDSLYVTMLVRSDNFIAEQLMLQVGYRTDSVYRVKAGIDHALSQLFEDIPQEPRWVDGSGLSRYNLFTPESMIYVLKKIYLEIPREKLLGYFATGGVSGTLEDPFWGGEEEPYIFAKSGTLSNNYCLSGFLRTRKGKILLFSFMDNHFKGPSIERKKEIKDLLLKLRDSYSKITR